MTYREFVESIKSDADFLKRLIEDSQIVTLDTKMSGEDDTVIFEYSNIVEELMNNATGIYGWQLHRRDV